MYKLLKINQQDLSQNRIKKSEYINMQASELKSQFSESAT